MIEENDAGRSPEGAQEERRRIPTFYMTVGAPCSGKTALSAELAESEEVPPAVISAEEVGMDLFGSRREAEKNSREVFAEMERRAKAALRDGQDVIYDARNLQRQRRVETLGKLRNIPCRKVCLWLRRPLEQCLLANAMRPPESRLPDSAVRGMHGRLDEPAEDEGWDGVAEVTLAPETVKKW